jgi:hypothetical protein
MFCKMTKYFLLFALWLYKKTHLKKETDKSIIGYQVSPIYEYKVINTK